RRPERPPPGRTRLRPGPAAACSRSSGSRGALAAPLKDRPRALPAGLRLRAQALDPSLTDPAQEHGAGRDALAQGEGGFDALAQQGGPTGVLGVDHGQWLVRLDGVANFLLHHDPDRVIDRIVLAVATRSQGLAGQSDGEGID